MSFLSSQNLEVIRRVTCLLSPSKNIEFCNEQISTWSLFSPPCASATYGSARMCRRKNRHHMRPRMDGIVGTTYQTYNSLPPCQEIDVSCHNLGENDDFVSKYPSSVAAILKPRFRDHVTPIFQPTPISEPGP